MVFVGVVSAAVALLARRDAAQSAAAAERSANAAEELARIEQQRRHEELTPRLSIVAFGRGPGRERIRLTMSLDGPDGLDRLDGITVRVRDDKERRPQSAGSPPQEEIDAAIWGPYRFVPRVDGADKLGRIAAAFSLARGESRPLEMEPSLKPHWIPSLASWRRDYAEKPIRLEVTCSREAEPAWRIPVEVEQPQPRFTTEAHPANEAVRVVARNVGTAPANQVRFLAPPGDLTVVIRGDQVPVLEVGKSASADVMLVAESTATSVKLAWADQFGFPQRQQVDLTDL